MKKNEVIKHSAAIQMSNRVSLLERRTWNILLAEAFENLLTHTQHEVSEKELMDALQIRTRNREHLKEMLRHLRRTEIEWNVLDKDKQEEWGITGLLAEGVISKGKVKYSFGPELAKKLYNPRMYARISLSIQSKFDSKHALALYELCLDYFDQRRRQGETPWIPIPQYRILLGLKDDEYPDFKHLNKRCIKEPVKEINKKSNLWLETQYQRESRRIVAVKVFIIPNKETAVQRIEALHPALPAPQDIPHPEVYKRLVGYFELSPADAREILEIYPPEYITGNLNELEQRIRAGKVKPKALGAYTKKILSQDIRTQKSLFDLEREERAVKVQQKKTIEQEKEAEEDAALKVFEQACENLYISLPEDTQELIDSEAVNRLSRFARDKYNELQRNQQEISSSLVVQLALVDARNTLLAEQYPDKLPANPLKPV